MTNKYADWLRIGRWADSYGRFILPPKVYRWPIYVLGLAGTGKSTLLANLALRFHEKGEGVLLIDTKDGDLAEKVAMRTPPEQLVYIAPGQCLFDGHPHHWAMNVLEVRDRSRLGYSRVHANVMSMFERMERADYSIMTQLRYHLDMSIRLALYQKDATLLTVRRIMTERDYRLSLMVDERISSEVREHFTRFDDNRQTTAYTRAQAVNSSIPRLKELLTDTTLYHLVTQPKSTVDIESWLNDGKLVVCNFARGLSSTQGDLLGNLMMAVFTNAAFARQPAGEARVWRLVSDEFDRLAGKNFAELIDKARSYRVFPVMSHQNIDQLKSGGRGEVFNAASSAPVVINFRTSKQDEATMRRWVKDEELSQELTSLKRFQASVTLFDGIPGLVDPGASVKIVLDPLQGEDSPAALEAAILSQKAHTTPERLLRRGKMERYDERQTARQASRPRPLDEASQSQAPGADPAGLPDAELSGDLPLPDQLAGLQAPLPQPAQHQGNPPHRPGGRPGRQPRVPKTPQEPRPGGGQTPGEAG
jgi:KaiC/GvpD/RAD55 family RecA-like ATPase